MTIYPGSYAEIPYLMQAEEDKIWERQQMMFERWCEDNDITGREKEMYWEEFAYNPDDFFRSW